MMLTTFDSRRREYYTKRRRGVSEGAFGLRLKRSRTMRHGEWHAIPSRPWTKSERRVVFRGFLGRFTVAIEPLIIAVFFSLLPIGLLLRKQETALLLAPIFGAAALAFLAYAVVLMLPSTRAMLETFGPIFIVDGYVQYRRRTEAGLPLYFVAVLDADRSTLAEWPLREWPSSIRERDTWPAMVEFSRFGGIHRIDGRSTGVLPAEIAPLGIGVVQHSAAQERKDLD
ncbi:MAG: hypothetical protein JO043_06330 [Candidatus Eremiobacteraeota bacterium]|nr:hypothetical protein [Candidatus Eremiobacteraeota bacterium]